MEEMTWRQMGEILSILFKVFFDRQVGCSIVPRQVAQNIIKGDAESFANQFVQFLANGGRVVLGGLKVATAPFDLKTFFGGKDWNYWKGPLDGKGLEGEPAGDSRSATLQEVDLAQSDFLTCLEGDETSIKGTEKNTRLKKSGRTLYGAAVFMGLWLDYQSRGEESVLETLFKEKGITYLDFFGDIFRDPNGNPFVLYLYRHGGGEWDWGYDWLGNDWRDRNFSASSQQVSS
jgi:hypothetical protein